MLGSAVRFLALVALLSLVRSSDRVPRVKTPLGNIQGYYKQSQHGRPYEAYEGVPFAQPPVGKRRFKDPEPAEAWSGELRATKMAHDCLQYFHVPSHVRHSDKVVGSEDCLYLNVYVPKLEGQKLVLPVIMNIHGGAFTHGSGNQFGAAYLMDKNVILVNINYRLGPLGFLSTEDEVVPGNMGLKDQSMALRWVHENIEYFGGDAKRITLVGISAGGASVHYHYFSPLSAGLFQNGLSISGTALDCWTQTENAAEKAKKLGDLMGCPTESTKEMIKCLRKRPARPIVHAVKEFMPWLYNPFTPFGPVVEKAGDKPFINRPPVEMLEDGKVLDVPWMTSLTSEEGLYPVAEFAGNEELLKELNDHWEVVAPHLLDFNYTIPLKFHRMHAEKIRSHYLGSEPINKENIQQVIKMVGDRLFVVDGEKAARMQAKVNKSPVWFYYYTYRAATSLSDAFSGTTTDFGVSHSDDYLLVMEHKYMNPTNTESDRSMQKDMLNLWTLLAEKREQDLSSIWRKVDPSDDDLHYLHIAGPGKFEMAKSNNLGDKKFWNNINFAENLLKQKKDEL